MSYADGWAALHLDMPARVPRTEYSAECYHWPLLRQVSGLPVQADSPKALQNEARRAFMKAWDYGFRWNVMINAAEFGRFHTDMGHAGYAENDADMKAAAASPFKEPEDVLAFDPMEAIGPPDRAALKARFEKHYADARADYPDAVNMTGIYVTCMSGLIDLFGWDLLLLAAGVDPEGFGAVAERYVRWMAHYAEALAAADVPVVMLHDDIVWTSGAFLAPAWYRRYLFPGLKRLVQPLRDAGKRVMFTSDGNFSEFIDDVADCGVHGFVLEPDTDMARIAERYGKTHVFIGNADTRILLMGDRPAIRAEVERCMRIGKHCPGFFLAVGNHIPANTPVENALYYNECYMELRKR